MSDLIGDLIARAIPVAFPAFMLVALLVHWGVLPDGTEGKPKKETKETKAPKDPKATKESKKEIAPPQDEGGE